MWQLLFKFSIFFFFSKLPMETTFSEISSLYVSFRRDFVWYSVYSNANNFLFLFLKYYFFYNWAESGGRHFEFWPYHSHRCQDGIIWILHNCQVTLQLVNTDFDCLNKRKIYKPVLVQWTHGVLLNKLEQENSGYYMILDGVEMFGKVFHICTQSKCKEIKW